MAPDVFLGALAVRLGLASGMGHPQCPWRWHMHADEAAPVRGGQHWWRGGLAQITMLWRGRMPWNESMGCSSTHECSSP